MNDSFFKRTLLLMWLWCLGLLVVLYLTGCGQEHVLRDGYYHVNIQWAASDYTDTLPADQQQTWILNGDDKDNFKLSMPGVSDVLYGAVNENNDVEFKLGQKAGLELGPWLYLILRPRSTTTFTGNGEAGVFLGSAAFTEQVVIWTLDWKEF